MKAGVKSILNEVMLQSDLNLFEKYRVKCMTTANRLQQRLGWLGQVSSRKA